MYRRQPSSSFNLIQQRLHHSAPHDAIVNVMSNYHFNIVFFPSTLDCHRSLSSHQPQHPPSDRYISTATPSASAPQHTQHPSPIIKPNIDLFPSSVCTSITPPFLPFLHRKHKHTNIPASQEFRRRRSTPHRPDQTIDKPQCLARSPQFQTQTYIHIYKKKATKPFLCIHPSIPSSFLDRIKKSQKSCLRWNGRGRKREKERETKKQTEMGSIKAALVRPSVYMYVLYIDRLFSSSLLPSLSQARERIRYDTIRYVHVSRLTFPYVMPTLPPTHHRLT